MSPTRMGVLALRRSVLIFQLSPILQSGELESELIDLARGLAESGLLVRIVAGYPSFAEAGRDPAEEARRRGWTPVSPGSEQGKVSPGFLAFDADGVPVDLLVTPASGGADGNPPVVADPESAFRAALERAGPSVVLFTDRWPPSPLVDACRADGIASVFLFRGMDDSPSEPHPPVDAVVALSDVSACYYHEVYGHRPAVLAIPRDMATISVGERDPRYLIYVDPTPVNGVYAFARIADEIGQVRPDIPILVVEASGTEADLANCGLDLIARGNLSIMAPTRNPCKYWRLARACVAPSLDRSDRPTTVLRAIANGVPTICSDRGTSREAAGGRVVLLSLPGDLTSKTRRLPDPSEVADWVREAIRLWDGAMQKPGDVGDPGLAFARFLSSISPGPMRLPVMPPGRSKAIALVPYLGSIEPSCESSLQALESEGVRVVRRGGQSAIDVARNDMCSEALHDGFESILFIDSDIGFNVRDALKLFARPEPVVSGVYAKKGCRSLASVFHSGVDEVGFGPGGGLYPLHYAATGFLRIRSEILRRMIAELELPVCNTRWNRGFWPFFMPMIVADGDHRHYLGEDWAFSHRIRQVGECPLVDTTIRLWHVGKHHFGWEEAGQDRPRFETYSIKLRG
jgi:hypothetical protein